LHHAYLFQGPEHVGKFTFAKILSKTILCEGATSIPCGFCRACTTFEHNAHPDFHLLDIGEDPHISVEKARELISVLSTRPLLGSLRIGMIEEAALLTTEAANSLLKTLEEPGIHVVLFLVTHGELLPTITSRCQRIRFGFVGSREIIKHLGKHPHSMEIASLAAGRPGLAIRLAERAQYEEYESRSAAALQVLSGDDGEKLIWAAENLGSISKMNERRDQARSLMEIFESVLRDAMLGLYKIEPVHRFMGDKIAECAGKMTPFQIVRSLRRVQEAKHLIRANVDPRLAIEYMLVGE